ncbi:MAG: tetratricopeptide repeat protein [Armatimonadetes bacterium]|nr:tetratricopeptide repeat protein [Armatimonadota bacterium]
MKGRVWVTVGAALAALAIVTTAGCRRKAERQYGLANALRAQGKPELAAEEYKRLAETFSEDPLAATAHYELTVLYRVHLGKPEAALEHYRTIADRYPKSRFADDALLWITWMGRTRKDLALIREGVNRLESDYGRNHSACARARIQLAIALLDAGSPETKAVCRSILQRYPDQPNQCAQARLILGRALEKIDRNDEAAAKEWESVRTTYPDTASAVEATQRLGWKYYGESRTAKGKPATAPPGKKRIEGVPAFAHQGGGVQTTTLEALAVLLKQRKSDADLPTLMAVSGAAFQFVYDPENRSVGSAVFATNPLQATAASYNFVALESSSSTPEEAMLSLCQSLDRGRPAMVPHTDGDWVVVVGYDQEQKAFSYVGPSGDKTQAFDQFAGKWKTATDQAGGALDSFYQFALGPAKGQVNSAHVVREAARRGASLLLQRKNVLGSPAGEAAYEALISDLEAHGAEEMPNDAADLVAWADGPLLELRQSRTAAAQFLEARAGGLPEPMAGRARSAAALYRSLAAKLSELHDQFPRPPESAAAGSSQPEYAGAALSAAKLAREALAIDRDAANQLAALASE